MPFLESPPQITLLSTKFMHERGGVPQLDKYLGPFTKSPPPPKKKAAAASAFPHQQDLINNAFIPFFILFFIYFLPFSFISISFIPDCSLNKWEM